MKDRKVIIIGAVSAVIVIALILIFMPSGQESDSEHEVISKRAKLVEETVDETPTAEVQDAPVEVAAVPVETAPAAPVEPAAPLKETQAVTPPAVKAVAPSMPAAEKKEPVQARKEPVPAAPVEKAIEKERKPARTAKATQPKKPETKPWAINVASFASLPEAQNLAISLRKAGYKSYVADFTRDSVQWHRVRVGFFSTRAEAEKAGRDIQSRFRVDTPWIVKPESAELKSHF
ncbi:MAG: SPOR domain-containing protein [Deltaproteobacteria bacterium]|nr:SPOR domain-containing protein [Deltaproteobacteria bacterium]MBZ0219055.1 SPOR domain-containing protein [Deltaproteobacteria bacterium]